MSSGAARPNHKRRDRPRVLLLWPGSLFGGGANFGVPQLLSIASAIRRHTDAEVDIIDLDLERAFGRVELSSLLAPGYDLVGMSCYSSYDYLKVMALGALVKRLLPRAWLVTGGYHASARPHEFTLQSSPFQFVTVGDGEGPMVRLVHALSAGKRPLMRIVGPEPLPDVNSLDYDWSLLARYRPVARSVASQAELYLSRGCPYDCAFCMERAKRDTSWRPLEAERAVEEIHRLDKFLDLRDWTLFIADALFGMKKKWRRTFLEGLARRPSRARKIWLLIRVDLIEREDIELMARANVSPGFGLESGDPQHLKRIRKAGKLDHYLEHMLEVSDWARHYDVPFGANIIVGHPGETESSLRTTAKYLHKLFLSHPKGTTGFLSVDPFRLYPGSPIDEERSQWEHDTGMRIHRYPWWHDGDQDFLSEWIDPSATLDFRTTLRLKRELLDPILLQLPKHFCYRGPARDFYQRAIDEQVDLCAPKNYLRTLGMWHMWRNLTRSDDQPTNANGSPINDASSDTELSHIARAARGRSIARWSQPVAPAIKQALLAVGRERFVAAEYIDESARDMPLPLRQDEAATLSAMHAYVAAFEALQLGPGDHYAELGGGTGYGAALASELVGAQGTVVSLEIDAELVARGAPQLAAYTQATLRTADAHDTDKWRGTAKVYVAFALPRLPQSWLDAMPADGLLVAPVGPPQAQVFTLYHKCDDGRVVARQLAPVRYVLDRSPEPPPLATTAH